jgi:hypothetical protein
MPTKCKICHHRERAAIDLALARGVSITALERRYQVHHDSLYRHARNHLPPPRAHRRLAMSELRMLSLAAATVALVAYYSIQFYHLSVEPARAHTTERAR